jgi:hypothetical protein
LEDFFLEDHEEDEYPEDSTKAGPAVMKRGKPRKL